MLALFRNGSALTQWFIILLLLAMPYILLPGSSGCSGEAPLSPCLGLQDSPLFYRIPSILLSILPVLAASFLLRVGRLITFSSFFPSLLFVLMIPVARPAGLTPDESIVLAFLFLGLHQLFRRHERGEGLQEIFMASFFFSMMTLIHSATLPLMLLPFAYLIIFRSYQWRQWVALPLGLALPHLYALLVYYWLDRLPELNDYYSGLLIPDPHPEILFSGWKLIASILLLLAFFTALLSNLSHLGEKKIHVRAQISLLSLLMVLSLIPVFLGKSDQLFFTILPLAWLLGMRMIDSRSRRFTSIMAALLFLAYIGSIAYHYLGYA